MSAENTTLESRSTFCWTMFFFLLHAKLYLIVQYKQGFIIISWNFKLIIIIQGMKEIVTEKLIMRIINISFSKVSRIRIDIYGRFI